MTRMSPLALLLTVFTQDVTAHEISAFTCDNCTPDRITARAEFSSPRGGTAIGLDFTGARVWQCDVVYEVELRRSVAGCELAPQSVQSAFVPIADKLPYPRTMDVSIPYYPDRTFYIPSGMWGGSLLVVPIGVIAGSPNQHGRSWLNSTHAVSALNRELGLEQALDGFAVSFGLAKDPLTFEISKEINGRTEIRVVLENSVPGRFGKASCMAKYDARTNKAELVPGTCQDGDGNVYPQTLSDARGVYSFSSASLSRSFIYYLISLGATGVGTADVGKPIDCRNTCKPVGS